MKNTNEFINFDTIEKSMSALHESLMASLDRIAEMLLTVERTDSDGDIANKRGQMDKWKHF